jgi:hypothetical protein
MPVSGKDTLNPFAGLDEKQKADTALPSQNGQSDNPFSALPDVKKKDETSGTPSGVGSQAGSSSQSPSTSPSEKKNKPVISLSSGFGENFLDHDINRKFDVSLSNPALDKTEFSLLDDDSRQKRFEERKAVAKAEIRSSPQKLREYVGSRMVEINSDIDNSSKNLKGIFTAMGFGGRGEVMQEERRRLEKEISRQVTYKNDLKNAAAIEAVNQIAPSYISVMEEFSPGEFGRQIMKIADPEMDAQLQEVEKTGGTLPITQVAKMEKLGLEMARNYLNQQQPSEDVSKLMSDIDLKEQEFDQKYPELVAQRVREKLGVYFYNKGKSGVLGYSDRSLDKAMNDPELGLTEAEKKVAAERVIPLEKRYFMFTEIPGSGFFRNFKNAIEKSGINTANTISGVLGNRTDADRAYDNLNYELETSRFRAPGESPVMKAELQFLKQKEQDGELSQHEKQRKLDLEKYVDVRSKWASMRDGMGDLTGQVMEMALLTKGLGAAGRGISMIGKGGGVLTGGLTSSAVGTALSNETVGLFLSSYFNSYDAYRSQALQIMPGDRNAANRDAYAKSMAIVEGLSERMFNDVKALNAFTKGVAPSIADITNRFINKEITQQVAKDEMRNALMKYARPFGKEFAKSTWQNSAEEAVVDLADGVASSVFGSKSFDIVDTGKKAVNTFVTTALHSPVVAGLAAHGAARGKRTENAFYKSAIINMAVDPQPYLDSVEELRLNGTIDQDQVNDKIRLINSAHTYMRELPETMSVKVKTQTGKSVTEKQMDFPQLSTYLIHRINEGILQEQADNTNDEVLKSQLNAKIKRSIEIRKGIIDGKVGVTADMQEVTNDPEKAAELGISDAAHMPSEALIGTPFHIEQLTPEEQKVIEIIQTSEELPNKVEGSMGRIIFEAAKDPKNHKQIIEDLVQQSIDPGSLSSNVGGAVVNAIKNLGRKSDYKSSEELLKEDMKDTKASVILPEENKTPIIIPLKKAQKKFDAAQNKIDNLHDKIDREGGLNDQIEEAENSGNEARAANLKMQRQEIYRQLSEQFDRSQTLSDPSLDEETDLKELMDKESTSRVLTPEESKRFSDALFSFADKILSADLTGSGGGSLQANLFKVPQLVIGNAVKAVAIAVKGGENLASAIKKGLALLKDFNVEEDEFGGFVKAIMSGQKPRIRVPVLPEETQEEIQEEADDDAQDIDEMKPGKPLVSVIMPEGVKQPAGTAPKSEKKSSSPGDKNSTKESDPIMDYKLTKSDELERYMTEATMEDIFGDPKSDDKYVVQRLADMLDDGMNLIGAAQVMFSSMELANYGPKLFEYIQNMSNDVAMGNKKAVLLATFLGEIKNEMESEPQLADRMRPLYGAVLDYYKNFMNQTGKSLAAGRLLRLYRDKYMADIFQDRILDDQQAKDLREAQRAESETKITDKQLEE